MRTAEEWAAEAVRRLNEKMAQDHAAGKCRGDLADAERIIADIAREAVAFSKDPDRDPDRGKELFARLISANALIEELWGRVHVGESHGQRTPSECDYPICVRVRALLA